MTRRLGTARPVRAAVAVSFRSFRRERDLGPADIRIGRQAQESQMPKLKTKSGAKKRFKITGTGKVVYAQRGKRHGMIKRTTKQIRNLRGTAIMFKTDGENVKKYFLPNG
jgi:large subunit ribosomal protein L35